MGVSTAVYRKQQLPNYTVFDEQRYFVRRQRTLRVRRRRDPGRRRHLRGRLVPGPARRHACRRRRSCWSCPMARRTTRMQQELRRDIVASRARETRLPIVYVNRVGGQDELVFDGASFVVDADGDVCAAIARVARDARTRPIFDGAVIEAVRGALDARLEHNVYWALVIGVRDYVDKNRFPGVLLGLSGGIDSALTLAVAVDAFGRDRVRAIDAAVASTTRRSVWTMPATMAGILGVRYDEIPIDDAVQGFHATRLRTNFKRTGTDATEENIQARIARHAADGPVEQVRLPSCSPPATSPRWPSAMPRLYGDMAGGFAVLKDIARRWSTVCRNYRNGFGRVIPERIITRPPSAELRADQTDQDSLPPYAILDAILEAYVEHDPQSRPKLSRRGHAAERRVQGGSPHQDQRIQAPAGGGWHQDHAARIRQGLALSDHLGVERVEARCLADKRLPDPRSVLGGTELVTATCWCNLQTYVQGRSGPGWARPSISLQRGGAMKKVEAIIKPFKFDEVGKVFPRSAFPGSP